MTVTPNGSDQPRPRSIADEYEDLLAMLDAGARQGLVHRLSVGYYEGWHPSREEVANIVARETGRITESEYLAGRRSPPAAPVPPRQEPRMNGSALPVGERPVPSLPPAPGKAGRAGRASMVDRTVEQPVDMQEFTVDCGELLARFRFVACGLSRGEWVLRAGRRCRLTSLHYQLIPDDVDGTGSVGGGPSARPVFTAPITVVPDNSAAPLTPERTPNNTGLAGNNTGLAGNNTGLAGNNTGLAGNNTGLAGNNTGLAGNNTGLAGNNTGLAGVGTINGSRGPWPVSAGTRELRFLIFPQLPTGPRQARRPGPG